MKTKIATLIFILALLSCSDKQTEIRKIEYATIIWHTEYFNGWVEEHPGSPTGGYYKYERGGWNKYESFIIYNPPETKEELLSFVNEYNHKTMTKDSVVKYRREYFRTFYKKTWKTKQAYKEDNYQSASSWLDESEQDMLLWIMWQTHDDGIRISYSYYNKDSKNDIESIPNATDKDLFNLK